LQTPVKVTHEFNDALAVLGVRDSRLSRIRRARVSSEGVENEAAAIFRRAAGDVVAAECAGDFVEDAEIVETKRALTAAGSFVLEARSLMETKMTGFELLAGIFRGGADGQDVSPCPGPAMSAPQVRFSGRERLGFARVPFAPVEVVEARR
jgi:hypothetical protein